GRVELPEAQRIGILAEGRVAEQRCRGESGTQRGAALQDGPAAPAGRQVGLQSHRFLLPLILCGLAAGLPADGDRAPPQAVSNLLSVQGRISERAGPAQRPSSRSRSSSSALVASSAGLLPTRVSLG